MVSRRSARINRGAVGFCDAAPAPEWLWWSIRRHTSHTARVVFLWLFSLWGDTLWEGHTPPVHDLPGVLNAPPAGQPATSQLNPHTYWAIDAILARLDEASPSPERCGATRWRKLGRRLPP